MSAGIIGLGYVGLFLGVVVDFRGVTRGIAAQNLIRL